MDNNKEIKEILKMRIAEQIEYNEKNRNRHYKVLSVGGYPVFAFPYFQIISSVLNVMENGRPVRPMFQAGREMLSAYGCENRKEAFDHSILCLAPAKYVPLLVEEGVNVNNKFSHPLFILDTQPDYPALVFAAYDGDSNKVQMLLKAGADKDYGIIAAQKCVSADHTSSNQKIACLQELKMAGIDLFKKTSYDDLYAESKDEIVKNWLFEGKVAYDAQKVISKKAKTKLPLEQRQKD